MLEKNVARVLERIGDADVVLDIGAHAQPFNRADYVVDILPYETRGLFGSLGPQKEHFSRETWIIHDICSRTPLPFADKSIDYVICSQVLEDIRDPIHVCSEIMRVGRAGYIEVPSRAIESVMGLEAKGYAGYYHHRWLINIDGDRITFRFKPHMLHDSWKYHLPKSHLSRLSDEDRVSYLFWEGSFRCEEAIQIYSAKVAWDCEHFVRQSGGYRAWRYAISGVRPRLKAVLRAAVISHPRLMDSMPRRLARRLRDSGDKIAVANLPEIYSR